MIRYCVVDTLYGTVDSLHEYQPLALLRMLRLQEEEGDHWDMAYWDEEKDKPGRLCSYVYNTST